MKKFLAIILSVLLVLGCAGCGDDLDYDTPDEGGGSSSSASSEAGTQGSAKADVQPLSMSVNRETGKLSITRSAFSNLGNQKSDGLWTIFVYLCGTDLESEFGSATDDLQEMIDGATGNGLRYVVETGGASYWMNETVETGRLQRYLIQDGGMQLIEERPEAGMGREATFEDFLQWGVSNYSSEHMGVVLWNHGGGSITGVCFDETDDGVSLSLRDIDSALFAVCGESGTKFDFIGFDACLMGTLEVANVLASYSDYMYGSEELEPGAGWDYTSIGSYISKNPGVDPVKLGAVVCDSFYDSCVAIEDDDLCTLAVYDLSKVDDLLISFNDFAKGMYESAGDTAKCADMIRGITKADNFGGNNRTEGYTNMVDMGGLVSACEQYSSGAKETLAALGKVVVYYISGDTHKGASGISLYYPLSVQGSEELSVFGDICPSPYYLSFVDRQAHGSVDAGYVSSYDDDFWFDDNGDWFWGLFSGDGDSDSSWYDEYWNYCDGYEPTGDSQLITFLTEPHLDEDGDFWFEFDDYGYDNAADVYGLVYELSPDGEDIIELGETYDLRGGWDSGIFMDEFDGWWLSLPDGQNLAIYIVESDVDHITYTSPIRLNGVDTNLRIRVDENGVFIEGAWNGVNEYGAASRDIIKLKSGDVILPIYTAYSLSTDDEITYVGEEYTVTGTPEIYYDIMDDGQYYFAFCIDDIYGDYYISDYASFTVEDGEVYFDM